MDNPNINRDELQKLFEDSQEEMTDLARRSLIKLIEDASTVWPFAMHAVVVLLPMSNSFGEGNRECILVGNNIVASFGDQPEKLMSVGEMLKNEAGREPDNRYSVDINRQPHQ